jgi:hypothetical protein
MLVQPTELGPHSFPLTGLGELSDELRQLVLEVIIKAPVNKFFVRQTFK